jgi:hypothetical protein
LSTTSCGVSSGEVQSCPTWEIEQIPGSHRQRIYCSDRCRMAARRQRIREQEQIQAEARARKEREQVAHRFGLLTEDSLDLLIELGKRDAKLALVVGRALARERDQALANQRRAEQERRMQAAKARGLGAELGILRWTPWTWARGRTAGESTLLAEKIKTIKVEHYLRVENNSKFVRGRGKVREEIERYILRQYAMEKHPSGVDYTITIPNGTDEQLEQIVYRDILFSLDARYVTVG